MGFSQSRLSNGKMAASCSYFLLAVLDLGICLRLGHGRGICIVDAFIIPSTCIRGRDIVITLLVRVSVCVSPLNS